MGVLLNSNKVQNAIKEEYRKSAASCQHFLKKHGTIQHPTQGKIPFALFPFQERVIDELVSHRFNIIAKARQLGISTVTAGYILWKMMHKGDYQVLVIATTQVVAAAIITKIQVLYDSLPSWYKALCKQTTRNALTVGFQNGSIVRAMASNEKSARSPSLSLLVVDEAAFVDKMDKIWIAAQATTSTGGDIILLSSPNGMGGTFYQIWADAMEGRANAGEEPFNPIKLDWRVHPERDDKWAAVQLHKLGKRGFSQEHEVEFLTSGHTVINAETLLWMRENMVKDPLEKRYSNNLWIWEYPDRNKSYVIPADVARGDASDYSAFHVMDVETGIQVASFKGKIGTREYASLLYAVGTEFNNALIAVDNRNAGWDVVQELVDMEYSNMYYTHKHDPFFDPNIQLRKNYDLVDKKDMTPGFTTTEKVRISMISKLEIALDARELLIQDVRTVNELHVFLWVNGRAQAQSGSNDDLVSALCMFLFLRETALKMRYIGIELSKKSVQLSHKAVYTPKTNTPESYKFKVGKDTMDLRELFKRKK